MKWNTTFHDECYPSIQLWKHPVCEKWLLGCTTSGFPLIRGFPSHGWNDTHPFKMIAGQVYECAFFTLRKISLTPENFRVPVCRGFALPWMIWYPSFNDDCLPTIRLWKVSLCEKWMVDYTTSGFPFIRGFPSHEWNETHPLTMIGGQMYECQTFCFLKNEWWTIQLQGFRL